jgi:hypothetical protein
MPAILHFALLRHLWVVWLAVLIAAFGALAPTVSHALAASQGGTSAWTEVCTNTGPGWVSASGLVSTDFPPPQDSAFSLTHCPFCLLYTDRAAPPPHALVHLFAVLGEPEAPTIRQAFFFITLLALTPPPRGPPAFF